ncbi:hypothetical protein CHS0354_009537 [Potamilus streckersoni]|uniref:Uncharacterized protein n=1 Tax=Potamilus streckersoni TaxID=2493646 RepID=A0AAE0SP44_9BIVA|nr:hypothetical protein CHS0354_009537 [Potamilus streckersoni]
MTNDHTFTVNILPENPNANEADDDHKDLCCYKCAINVHRSCAELASVEDLAKDIKEREDPRQISDNLEAVKELFQILLESRSKCLKSIENQKPR